MLTCLWYMDVVEGAGMGTELTGPLMLASAIRVWMEVVPSLLTLVRGGGLEPRAAVDEGGGGGGHGMNC